MSTARGLVVILIDGLSSAAALHMGCLEGMVRSSMGARKDICSGLPPISKPLYHCLFTGVEPSTSGLLSNHAKAPSRDPDNLFGLARQMGLTTCAAAHRWFGKLFARWDVDSMGRFQDLESGDLCFGIYYSDDQYPDSHVLQDGEYLIRRHRPGLTLIHTMGVDHAAHLYGTGSRDYTEAVMRCDQLASRFLWERLSEGFAVMVTSDHGVRESGLHGGTSEEETRIPLWIFPEPSGALREAFEGVERQKGLKGLMAELLKAVGGGGQSAPE
ncbi:MAG: alkaline phosphatase family protein [Thermanaerothrix sp.]|nr:alkaline phosphatase family protein [Thermanaerothrix sp.]